MRGATKICIFDQVMDAPLYVGILCEFLLPFIRKQFPDCEYRFMQDNDPKHTSQKAREFYEEEGINWWPTPASSADINPIKRVCRELKFFIVQHTKPLTKKELVAGIMCFLKEWMTPQKCVKYIAHTHNVLPKVTHVGYVHQCLHKREPYGFSTFFNVSVATNVTARDARVNS